RLANRGLEGASAEIGPWTATWARGAGYPDRDPNLDALPGFRNPPPGYGEVPFWWWTGDPLDVDRLTWQLDQLHQKGISGVQVNYAHEDTPGWPTYAAEPPIFSDAWWRVWGQVVDACRQRGMGIGLSTYTLDWPGADNLFRRLFTSRPELNALRLEPLPRQRFTSGQSVQVPVPSDLVAARAYPVKDGQVQRGGVDLRASIRDGRLEWTPDEGEWELWLVRAERQANTLNPLLTGIGDTIIRDFYQRFQEATPNRSAEGLDYFFNDELHIGAGARVWNSDFADEFQRRKGYNLFEVLPALWADLGPVTPKVRIDYADVRMALMEERYFQPIYQWHASRGLIFACDSGGRGLQPDEFGDYFRATRWYSAPGHDTPGGHADLIKGKVSSSIASLYRRPRVWLEGYHSLGWGATPERLMFATRENYLYGCTLLNLHGLYYSTHGSFWEWAPPCYHFRMPYWEHMGVFLKYFERLSYLLSQGTFVADVAVLYPVASFEAGLDGGKATQIAFDTGRALLAAGVNFEFLDADSLARATVGDARLATADSSYRALVFPAMEAARWSSLQKAAAFAQSGGLVVSVGALPLASDRAGRDDPDLDALVAA
ncbi:MAG TPA: glycosyl hydrolase, partial [Verrucomicrobiota bacterium]|nr:glycosyl hydrolase [Verrucomicrobiota bacterium]